MNRINKRVLPENIVDILAEREVFLDDVKLLVSALTTGNKARRIIIWSLHDASHLWQTSSSTGKRANAKGFKEFLNNKGVLIDPSELCRSLKAAEVERLLGLEIGTCNLGVLRPLIPLLKKKESRYIPQIWAAAENLADGKKVKARHVKKVMELQKYSGVGNKKAKKSLAIANNVENRKQYRKQLEELSKELTAEELADLVMRAKKLMKSAA